MDDNSNIDKQALEIINDTNYKEILLKKYIISIPFFPKNFIIKDQDKFIELFLDKTFSKINKILSDTYYKETEDDGELSKVVRNNSRLINQTYENLNDTIDKFAKVAAASLESYLLFIKNNKDYLINNIDNLDKNFKTIEIYKNDDDDLLDSDYESKIKNTDNIDIDCTKIDSDLSKEFDDLIDDDSFIESKE